MRLPILPALDAILFRLLGSARAALGDRGAAREAAERDTAILARLSILIILTILITLAIPAMPAILTFTD